MFKRLNIIQQFLPKRGRFLRKFPNQFQFSTTDQSKARPNSQVQDLIDKMKKSSVKVHYQMIEMIGKEGPKPTEDTIRGLIHNLKSISPNMLNQNSADSLIRIVKDYTKSKKNLPSVPVLYDIVSICSDLKIGSDKLWSRFETITLARLGEISEKGKDELIKFYKVFAALNRKSVNFWKEMDECVLKIYDTLTSADRIEVYECMQTRIQKDEDLSQVKNNQLYKLLSDIFDSVSMKKLNLHQYTSLVKSLVGQQLKFNTNNSLLLHEYFQNFPQIIQKMNYYQGVINVIAFMETKFLSAESDFVDGFFRYIIKHASEPSIYTDIVVLAKAAEHLYNTSWGNDTMRFIMEKLSIRRDFDMFIEDVSLYSEKGEEKLFNFYLESSEVCRMNNIKKLAQIVETASEIQGEGFFKNLDLKDLKIGSSKSYL